MTRSSLRLWGVLIVASIGLAACSSSESSSSIRTRNSATVDACILVSPSTDTPEITARLANPSCGVAIVDMTAIPNPQYALRPTGSTTRPKSPQVEHLNPTLQQVTSTHSSGPYRFAYEARDADNNPIHYVEVINESETGEAASMLLKYAVPFEISQSESCIKPNVYPIASRPNFLISGDTTSCDNSRQLVINQGDRFVGVHPMAKPTPANVTSYMLVEHFSLTTIKNGFPDQRFTAIPLGGGQFEYRFYRFSPSVEVRPFQAAVVSNPVETTAAPEITTTTIEDTTTTVPNEPTPSSSTSTTSPPVTTTGAPQTSTTTPTTPTTTIATTTTIDTTATTAPATIATQRSQADACENIEGIEVFPGLDQWTSSTRFEISISNDCMTYPSPDDGSRRMWHNLSALNNETGEEVFFNTSGDSLSRITYNGRLYAGDWTIKIEQNVWSQAPGDDYFNFSARTLEVTVTQDTSEPWDLCESDDIDWNGSDLTLDCDYTAAHLVHQQSGTAEVANVPMEGRGAATSVSLPEGWNIAVIEYNVDGYISYLPMVLCSTDCGVLPNELQVTIETVDSTLTATAISDECAYEDENSWFYQLRQANANLILFNPSSRAMDVDGFFDAREPFTVRPRAGTDHLIVYQILREDCIGAQTGRGFLFSVVPVTESITTESDQEQSNVPSPARVSTLEFSRTEAGGAPIVVSTNETSVLIAPNNIPSYALSAESGVVSIEARSTGGQWRTLSAVAPSFVPIDQDSTAIEVKYTFSDGTEAVVTKPIVSSSDVVTTDDKSTSNILLFTVLILVSVAVSLGGYAVTRRKSRA